MKKKTSHFHIIFLSLLFLFSFTQCISLRSCNDDLIGKYSLVKKGNFTNYLILNENGNYYHYYKENGVEKSSSGTWEKVDDPYCKIRLTNWENYNEKGLSYNVRGSIFYINGDYLDTSPDGEDLDSFKKMK